MALPITCTNEYDVNTDSYTVTIVFNGTTYTKGGLSLSEASNYITEFKISILETQGEYEFETCIE